MDSGSVLGLEEKDERTYALLPAGENNDYVMLTRRKLLLVRQNCHKILSEIEISPIFKENTIK